MILTSLNFYSETQGPHYRMFLGKIAAQELHCWEHYPGATPGKWEYAKGFGPNSFWYYFYTPLHNSTSTREKIVSWYHNWAGTDATHQLWAFII